MAGKRVFIEADFARLLNPKNPQQIPDLTGRIDAELRTIWHCLNSGASSVVLAAHLGFPGGRPDENFSLRPVATALAQRLCVRVVFLSDCVGPAVQAACASSPRGSLVVLENLGFHSHGTRLDDLHHEAFTLALAELGDVHVDDTHHASHARSASTLSCDFAFRATGFRGAQG